MPDQIKFLFLMVAGTMILSSGLAPNSFAAQTIHTDPSPGKQIVVSETPGVQLFFDRVLGDILHTQAFAKPLTGALRCDAKVIHHHIGMSLEASSRLAQRCRRDEHAEPVQKFVPYPRTYLLEYNPKSPITSWSHITNQVQVISDGDELGSSELAQRLSHETALSLDLKMRVDPQLLPQLGLVQLPRFEDRLEVASILSEPFIEYGLGAIRAFLIERATLAELHRQYPETYRDVSESYGFLDGVESNGERCLSALTTIIFRARTAFWRKYQEQGYRLEWSPPTIVSTSSDSFEAMAKRLGRKLMRLKNLKVQPIGEAGRLISLCSHMAEPQIGGGVVSASYGPRPRTTGGSGDRSLSEALLEALSRESEEEVSSSLHQLLQGEVK